MNVTGNSAESLVRQLAERTRPLVSNQVGDPRGAAAQVIGSTWFGAFELSTTHSKTLVVMPEIAADAAGLLALRPDLAPQVRALSRELTGLAEAWAASPQRFEAGMPSGSSNLISGFQAKLTSTLRSLDALLEHARQPAAGAPPADADVGTVVARLATILQELRGDRAPLTVDNAQIVLNKASSALWDASIGAATLAQGAPAQAKLAADIANIATFATFQTAAAARMGSEVLGALDQCNTVGSLEGNIGAVITRLGGAVPPRPAAVGATAADPASPTTAAAASRAATDAATAAEAGAEAGAEAAPTSRYGPTLTQYGTDLVERAEQGELRGAVAREAELKQLVDVLAGGGNPLVTGGSKAGKSAVVDELARRLAVGDPDDYVVQALAGTRVVSIDLGQMVGGAAFRGDFEGRINKTIDDARATNGQVVLLVRNAEQMTGVGKAEGSADPSTLFATALGGGKPVQMIAEIQTAKVEDLEKAAELHGKFTEVPVDPLAKGDVRWVLEQVGAGLGDEHVRVTPEAITTAIAQGERLFAGKPQPSAGIEILESAMGAVRSARRGNDDELDRLRDELARTSATHGIVSRETDPDSVAQSAQLAERITGLEGEVAQRVDALVTARRLAAGEPVEGADVDAARAAFPNLFVDRLTSDHVKEAAARLAKVDLRRANMTEEQRMAGLEQDLLSSGLLGRDRELKVIAGRIEEASMGFRDPKRPILTTISFGPPGTGKTEAAKALSRAMFDTDEAMIRVDFSNLAQYDQVKGGVMGYVARELKARPRAVVLLDEIEKAPAPIVNGFLTAFGEGYIALGSGNRVERVPTTEAIFDFTTNLRSVEEIKARFPPEFVDRIDEMLHFDTPDRVHFTTLAGMAKDGVAGTVQAARGVRLLVSPAALDAIVDKAHGDESIGVRGLKRLVISELGGAARAQMREARPGDELRIDVGADGAFSATRVRPEATATATV